MSPAGHRAVRAVAALAALTLIGALFLDLYSVSVDATVAGRSISQTRSVSGWKLLGTDDILLAVLAADVLIGLALEVALRTGRLVLAVPALAGIAAVTIAAVHAARPPDITAAVEALRAQGAHVAASSNVAVGGWLALGAAMLMSGALILALARTPPRGARG